jgi:two-component system, cell cycle response regulator DivK
VVKILVADDDFDLRTIVSDLLEMKGFDVVLACNGEEALANAISERPQLIILDISMPKMDGFTVVGRLREHAELKNTPVIAFTAHALKGDSDRALGAGCDGYISKPFRSEELLAEINRLLRKTLAA